MAGRGQGPTVGLLATCLVDLFRPSVAFAAVKLLEAAGCVVEAPPQTCCGQPAFNAGDRESARALALQTMATFAPYEYVVAPSGSCAGMMVKHYPELFAHDPELSARAQDFAARTHELVSFLTDVRGLARVDARYARTACYHDSCAGLRELGVAAQPRALLASVDGLALTPLADCDVCCGFGGAFAVKYGEISTAIVDRKTQEIMRSGAQVVLAGDLGCLMNIAGRLTRIGASVEARHVAEVLADMTDTPPIGGWPQGSAR